MGKWSQWPLSEKKIGISGASTLDMYFAYLQISVLIVYLTQV